MTIQVLPEYVVGQIAAGEVVERPASVVKELVENALDAGATSVHIAVQEGGRRLIRVSDDGAGIPSDQVELAFARHATSKLRTVDDLARIRTLGFRGEALASIASVSHVTITTRHRSEIAGLQLRIEGGTRRGRQSVGAPAGTVLVVENLFFNTPARLKFLKKDNTEKRYIAALVTRYAMAYPHVRFVLEQDGREVFRSSGSGEIADVLVKALGLDIFRQMIEVSAEDAARDDRPAVRVTGYTSVPDLNRSDRSHITLFVNGRSIQDSSLTYAVIQAYHTLLMTGRYPMAVLMIELSPEDVDVNVHPTKAEVRFRDPNAVFSTVQRAIRETVISFAPTPDMRAGRFGVFSSETGDTDSSSRLSAWRPAAESRRHEASQLDMPLPIAGPGRFATQRSAGFPPSEAAADPTAIPVGPEAPLKPRTLPMLRVVGQIGATYIVAEGPSGMYLVDQHAAHERILYEQFMENYESRAPIAQLALEGQTVDLSPVDARLIEEKQDVLFAVGFHLEPFGPGTFVIRAVPAMLADSEPAEAIRAILDDLEADKVPGQNTLEEKLIRQVCRRAAVKAGQILSHDQMQDLIRQLERCRSPLTCPHGRPTMIHMSGEQLAREFGRA